MHWKHVLNLVAAFALALGAHFVTESELATMLADVVAVVIAQNNRELKAPKTDRRRKPR